MQTIPGRGLKLKFSNKEAFENAQRLLNRCADSIEKKCAGKNMHIRAFLDENELVCEIRDGSPEFFILKKDGSYTQEPEDTMFSAASFEDALDFLDYRAETYSRLIDKGMPVPESTRLDKALKRFHFDKAARRYIESGTPSGNLAILRITGHRCDFKHLADRLEVLYYIQSDQADTWAIVQTDAHKRLFVNQEFKNIFEPLQDEKPVPDRIGSRGKTAASVNIRTDITAEPDGLQP